MEHGKRKITFVQGGRNLGKNFIIHNMYRKVYKNGDVVGLIRLYKIDNVKVYDFINSDVSITFNNKKELYNYLDLYNYKLDNKNKSKMIKISKEKWEKISNDYKGIWTGYNGNKAWIGKRTVLSGCISNEIGSLLVEGIHFIIE